MGHLPYLHTWTAQSNAKKINLKSTFDWGYLTNDGNKIYDLSSGSYHQSFGLRNQQLEQALIDQLSVLPMAIPKAEFELKEKVSQRFIDKIGLDGRIFYTLSGAESNENAIKMARQITGRKNLVSCDNSYHGATLGALAVTGDWRKEGAGIPTQFHAFIPNFYNDPKLVETKKILSQVGEQNIAAICLETITGGNGVYIPPQSYYDEIQKICNNFGIKLILDEVICGFGRCGQDFGLSHYNLRPDFITFAKNISGGFFPFGAVFVSEENASYFDDHILNCGLTNAAHPIGLKLLDEVLNLIEDQDFINLKRKNEALLENFEKDISNISIVDKTRRIGMLMAIDLIDNKLDMRKLWEELLKRGIFINMTRNTIILCPYLNFPNQELSQKLLILKEVIEDLYV